MVFSAKSRNSAGTSSFGSNMPPSSDFNREVANFRHCVLPMCPGDDRGISTDALPARARLSCNPGYLMPALLLRTAHRTSLSRLPFFLRNGSANHLFPDHGGKTPCKL